MSLSKIGRVHFAALVIAGGLFVTPMPVASAQPCPDVEAVFARGTGEPAGVGGIGEPFVDELRTAIGPKSLNVYPVNYEASGNFSDQALINALLTVGGDRILFSVDYPYADPALASRWIEQAPISESDRRKITHGNAIELFGL